MTKAIDFLNALVLEAKNKMAASGRCSSAAVAEYNGKKVTVSLLNVNTNSKRNVVQTRYKINDKIVSAAKIVAAIES